MISLERGNESMSVRMELTFESNNHAVRVLDAINPDNYPGNQICINVDYRPGDESYIRYLQPTSGAGSLRMDIPLPQARICFRKGLFARKIW